MVKNMENEQENAPKKNSNSGLALGWVLFLVVLIAAGLAGGFGWQQMTQMQQKIADLEQNTPLINKLSNKQNVLEQRITLLESTAPNSFAAAMPTSENAAEDQEMRARFNQWLEQKEADLDAVLQKLQSRSLNAEQTAAPKPQMPEVLLAAGALTVKDMAERGLPFAYEAEVLRILAKDNPQAEEYAKTIERFSHSGVIGAKVLIENFNNIYAILNDMPTVEIKQKAEAKEPEAQTWYGKAWQWIKKFAVHRKKMPKPQFSAEKDTVYSLVNQARFAEALAQMKTDVKYNSVHAPILQKWQKQAQKYVKFSAAMDALLMNALANIRLKEMQH